MIDFLARGVGIPGDDEVVAVHVDGTDVGLSDQTARLEPWFRELGVEYVIKPLEVPEQELLPMDCFRCSWNRRKALFIAAGDLGCNKVALGHHADDAAATTLMSMMYKGQVETLAPRLEFFQGRFLVIRPLIYLSAAAIQPYTRACRWASPSELSCPREGSARRVQIEQFLATSPKKERDQIRADLWRLGQQGRRAQDGGPAL